MENTYPLRSILMLKPIPSNPAYLISDSGQIFSTISNKYLKTHCGTVGYPVVGLTVGKGKRTMHTVHSLVAEAFIGSRPANHEINHKDGCKTNNHVSNLEYVIPSVNIRHAFKTGLAPTTSNIIYDSIDDIVDKLLTDPTASWKSVAEDYGYKGASGMRKLIMRDLKRNGRTSDIDKLNECMQKRSLDKLHEGNKGRPAHNRKQVICNGVTYASLKEACNALGLINSKACVAINKGKAIKGFHLVYA